MRKSSLSNAKVKKTKSVSFADEIGKKLYTIKQYQSLEKLKSQWSNESNCMDDNNHTNETNNQLKNLNNEECGIHLKRSSSLPLKYPPSLSNDLTQNREENSFTEYNSPSNALVRHGLSALSHSYRNWILLFDTNTLVFNHCNHNVKLTKINVIVTNGIPKVCGMVTVKNLHYDKYIFIRYTFNEWQTCNDKPTLFHLHNDVSNIDQFKFFIPLIISGSNSRTFEFAICYQTGDDRIFWDNNNGQNYKIKYKNQSNNN